MIHKIWNTVKYTLPFVFAGLILYFLIVFLLPYIPKSSTPFHASINVMKITDPGEPSGTIPVTIEGSLKTYLLPRKSGSSEYIDLHISSLDGYTDFVPVGTNDSLGEVDDRSGEADRWAHYYAYKDGLPYSVSVCFTRDFDYWLISVAQWDAFLQKSQIMAYYAGSTNENATFEDFKTIFAPIDFAKAWEKDPSDAS